MGRFDPKFSDEQRQAIADAMIDRQMSAPEAVRAAAEGLDGLPPFTMAESTARDVAAAARQQRQPHTPSDYEARLQSFQERGITLIDRELTRIEERAEKGPLGNSELSRLSRIMKFRRTLEGLRDPAPASGRAPTNGKDPSHLVDGMLARMDRAASANGVVAEDE